VVLPTEHTERHRKRDRKEIANERFRMCHHSRPSVFFVCSVGKTKLCNLYSEFDEAKNADLHLPHDLFKVGGWDDEVDCRFSRGSINALAIGVAEGFDEELDSVA